MRLLSGDVKAGHQIEAALRGEPEETTARTVGAPLPALGGERGPDGLHLHPEPCADKADLPVISDVRPLRRPHPPAKPGAVRPLVAHR